MSTKTYRPREASRMDSKTLRREYTRLAQVANRRLANLEKNNLGTWGSRRFGGIRGMSDEYVEAALLEVSRYLRDVRHTVRGERDYMRREIAELHRSKYTWVNESNFYQFTDFMDKMREQYGAKLFDSSDFVKVFREMDRLKTDPEKVYEVFKEVNRLSMDPQIITDNLEFFTDNVQALRRLRPARKESGMTASAWKRKVRRVNV